MSEKPLVMVPLDAGQLAAIAAGGALDGPLRGIAADQTIADTFGVELGEPAEAAALQMADVLGVATVFGRGGRQVVVTEASYQPAPAADENGLVTVPSLNRAQVLAFFTGPADPEATRQASGLSLDDAWASPAIQHMLATQSLGWHDLTELV